MLWDQRFELHMALRLLVRRGISIRNSRGKVILAIARNRYKQKAKDKGLPPRAAARFAIDAVLRVIDRMEHRERSASESIPSGDAGCDAGRESCREAKAA